MEFVHMFTIYAFSVSSSVLFLNETTCKKQHFLLQRFCEVKDQKLWRF